jgi:hypothetical protein
LNLQPALRPRTDDAAPSPLALDLRMKSLFYVVAIAVAAAAGLKLIAVF